MHVLFVCLGKQIRLAKINMVYIIKIDVSYVHCSGAVKLFPTNITRKRRILGMISNDMLFESTFIQSAMSTYITCIRLEVLMNPSMSTQNRGGFESAEEFGSVFDIEEFYWAAKFLTILDNYVFEQILHSKGRSSVCMVMCFFNL